MITDIETEKAVEIKEKFEALIPIIHRLIDDRQFRKLTKIFNSFGGMETLYHYINGYIKKLENQSFKDIEEIKQATEQVESTYNKIIEIIED